MKFSKKITALFWTANLFLMTPTANAKNIRDNVYLGLGITDSITHYDIDVTNPTTNTTIVRNKTDNDVLGNAFLGYGYTTCQGVYFATEMGTLFPKKSGKISRPGATITGFVYVDRFKIQDYVTGDILLGYRPIECFLWYIRGGVSYAHIAMHQFANTSAGTPTFDANEKGVAGRVGTGINIGCNRHFGVGLDYIFTLYPKLKSYWSLYNIDFIEKSDSNNITFSGIYSF